MKIDLHVHSKEISPCGWLTAAELIPLYKKAGYDAIVLSNHFNTGAAEKAAEHTGRNDFGKIYLEHFREAETLGKKAGLLVLCGYELRFDNSPNDYLIFGMPEEMTLDCRKYFKMDVAEFSEIAKAKGFLLCQAHPFRNKMSIVNPALLFGIEVKNGNPRHDSRNDIADMWAEKFQLHKIAGSDCHRIDDAGRAGILTGVAVRTMTDLVNVLKSGNYTLF